MEITGHPVIGLNLLLKIGQDIKPCRNAQCIHLGYMEKHVFKVCMDNMRIPCTSEIPLMICLQNPVKISLRVYPDFFLGK